MHVVCECVLNTVCSTCTHSTEMQHSAEMQVVCLAPIGIEHLLHKQCNVHWGEMQAMCGPMIFSVHTVHHSEKQNTVKCSLCVAPDGVEHLLHKQCIGMKCKLCMAP